MCSKHAFFAENVNCNIDLHIVIIYFIIFIVSHFLIEMFTDMALNFCLHTYIGLELLKKDKKHKQK